MCSKNIFFTLGFWVGLPQNLGFGFPVKRALLPYSERGRGSLTIWPSTGRSNFQDNFFRAACGFGLHRVALSLDRGNYPERFQTQTEAGGREKKLKRGKRKKAQKRPTDRPSERASVALLTNMVRTVLSAPVVCKL